MGHSQELSEFQHGTVIGPVQQAQLLNLLTPKYSTVNRQWYPNKVEAIGNDSNSATKL